jgi:branched-subunit amino acid aminotransferase/4-amino-4-deoxychorismate lyase
MKLYCNQRLYDADMPLFTADNRSFRYGEGLFETIRVKDGLPFFWPLHLKRLHRGIGILGMDKQSLDDALLLNQLQHLCSINQCANAARVRISVYPERANGTAYIIEAAPLPASGYQLNTKGWLIDLFADVQISIDKLANLKKSSYLPYALAYRHAEQHNLDESLVRNALGNICEGSRTNIFVVKGGALFTPALTQGCVAGVMRHHILEYCSNNGFTCHEVAMPETFLQEADEIFLTNAIQGIRWVSGWGQKAYDNGFVQALFNGALATIRP